MADIFIGYENYLEGSVKEDRHVFSRPRTEMQRNYLKDLYNINFEISIKNLEKEILELYHKNDMMNATPQMSKEEKKAREQIFFKEIEVIEAKIELNKTLQKLDMFGVGNLRLS